MSSSAQIVKQAFRRLNIISSGEELSSEDAADGLRALNGMIASWANDGVRVAPPLPAKHEQGTIALLAVRIAPDYGKTLSTEIKDQAREGWLALQADYVRASRSRFDSALISMPSQRYAADGRTDYESWKPDTDYATGDIRANQGRVYECTTGGRSSYAVGPVKTIDGEVDGTVVWSYRGTL